MKKKNITMKVLMETMRKLNQEGYEDLSKYDPETGKWNPLVHVDPKTGKKSAPKDNISFEFPNRKHLSRQDKEQFLAATDPTKGAGSETSLDLGPNHKGNKEKNKPKGHFSKDLPAHASSLSTGETDEFSREFPMAANEASGVIGDPDSNPFSASEPTRTMAYDLGDTIPDAASETEELVDRLSDKVVAAVTQNGELDPNSEEGRATIENAIMDALRDMDNSPNLYDR